MQPKYKPSTRRKPAVFRPGSRSGMPAGGEAARRPRDSLADLGLATVCSGAHCPNLPECYARGTATFLILGDPCTRSCRFCAVAKGAPGRSRPEEPEAVAEACARLRLRHVVITSVTRDDLPDGGAGHFARTIRAVRGRLPGAVIEVLTPDFRGRPRRSTRSWPPRRTSSTTTWRRCLGCTRRSARRPTIGGAWQSAHAADGGQPAGRRLYTKSGLMVGLGETPEEVSRRCATCGPPGATS